MSDFEKLLSDFKEECKDALADECDNDKHQITKLTPPKPLKSHNYEPARICKFHKSTCKRMDTCSFIHTTHPGLELSFCACCDNTCPFPHPLRRRNSRKRGRFDKSTSAPVQEVCAKCGGPHLIYHCNQVECFKCHSYGHFANACQMKRSR